MFATNLTRNQSLTVICLALAVVTLGVYWPVTHHDFVNFDDHEYITDNAHVNSGLTWSGVVWAFQNKHAGNWHPLTWVSHMADCQLYGLNPGGHHFTNLLFHIANTLLLFLWLNQLTGLRPNGGATSPQAGALWRSAFVAALFAWHPLHVESVAWAAERKDVLSAFFFLLTLWAYAQYVSHAKSQGSGAAVEEGANIKGKGGDGNIQHPTSNIQHPTQGITHHASRITHHVSPYYCLALLFFACGLMSKPMVVTLPFVLLLIDFWPLGRFSGFTRRRGASARQEFQVSSSEKASTLNPVKGRGPHGALHTQPSTESAARLLLEKLPFFALAAAGSLVTYLVQKSGGAVWSSPNLPFSFRLANALMSYLRYISKTFWPADLAFIYPYPHHWSLVLVMGAALLLAAWSVLFVLTARRYPYLAVGWLWYLGTLVPAIGLVQVGVQSMADRYLYIPSLGLFILIVWGLNDFLSSQPQKQRLAAVIGAAALSGCLIGTWFQLKHWENSVKLFSHAIKVTTDNYAAYDCLGEVLEQLGRKDEAAALYAESVRIEPGYPIGQFKLGMILLESGRPEDAFTHLKAAADLMPRNPDLQYDLGVFLSQHGKPDEAISRLNAALGLRPDFPEALNQLAWILSTNPDPKLRSGQKAVPLAERACELTQNRLPAFLTTLSVAYAEAGRFSDAITTAQKARDLAVASGQKEIAARDEALLKLYESHQPFRETN